MFRLLVILIFINLQVFAQNPGDFDLSFGNQGKVTLNVGDLDQCEDVIIDSSDNIYFGGYTTTFGSPNNTDFLLGKLLPNGQLDLAFGVNGYYRGDFPKTNASTIHNLELVNDGILIFGSGLKYGIIDTQYLFVSKVLFDGTIDTTFADSGTFSGVFLSPYNYPGSITLQNDGKILVCGSAYDSLTVKDAPLIGRLFPNGMPDTTFSPTGFKYWDMSGSLQNAGNIFPSMPEHGSGAFLNDVLIMNSGNYFFSGYYDTGASIHCITMMINPSGTFEGAFGIGGYLVFQNNATYSNKIVTATLFKNQILLGVELNGMPGNTDFLVQPMDTNGTLLPVFNADFYGQRDVVKNMTVQNDKLYLTGYSTLISNIQSGYDSDYFTIAKYDDNGIFNNQFASNGLLAEDFSSNDEAGSTSIFLKGNKIIVAGYLNNLTGTNITDFGFMCFYNDNLLGIENKLEKDQLNVYPNPATGYIYIEFPKKIEQLNLYTITGQKVKVQTNNTLTHLNVDNLSKGIYLLEIGSENEQTIRKQLVIQ